jgi:hypothetical protein
MVWWKTDELHQIPFRLINIAGVFLVMKVEYLLVYASGARGVACTSVDGDVVGVSVVKSDDNVII